MSFPCYYNPEVAITGKCPVTKCWANFSRLPSGCIFDYLQRNEITLSDLALITKKERKKLEAKYQKQRELVATYVEFLQDLEEPPAESEITCPDCGILRHSKGPCLQKNSCKERQKLYRKYLKKAGWLSEIQISPQDFYRLFTRRKYQKLLAGKLKSKTWELLENTYRQQCIVRGINPELAKETKSEAKNHDIRRGY